MLLKVLIYISKLVRFKANFFCEKYFKNNRTLPHKHLHEGTNSQMMIL